MTKKIEQYTDEDLKKEITKNQTLRDAIKDEESPKRVAYNQTIARLNAQLSLRKKKQHYYGA